MEKILIENCKFCTGQGHSNEGDVPVAICTECNGFGKEWKHDFLEHFQNSKDFNTLRFGKDFEIKRGQDLGTEEREKLENTLSEADKNVKSNPSDALAWKNKILALADLGKDNYVHLCCDKFIKLKPKDVFGWYTKAYALCSCDWQHEAIECFDKALEIEPNNALILYNKGVALVEINERNNLTKLQQYDEALKCFDKSIELVPVDIIFYITKGYTLAKLQQYDEALKCFDKSIELDPYDPLPLHLKANTLAEVGDYNKALECFDKLIELKPKDTNLICDKGLTFVALKRYDKALKCFDKVIEISSDLNEDATTVTGYKVDVLQLLGNFEEYEKHRTLYSNMLRSHFQLDGPIRYSP